MKLIDVVLTGPLQVNTCVVHLDGSNVFLTDPAACQESGDEEVLVSYLDEKHLEPVAVILTHGHFDHISGLKPLKKRWPDLPVFIHQADASSIGKDSEIVQNQALTYIGLRSFLPACSNLPDPDDFLKDAQTLGTLKFKNLSPKTLSALNKWKVISTPGHTPGSVCLYNAEEKLLISGDTVFYNSWGRTDFPGGSESQIQDSLSKLYKKLPPDTKVYPGHEYYGFDIRENY